MESSDGLHFQTSLTLPNGVSTNYNPVPVQGPNSFKSNGVPATSMPQLYAQLPGPSPDSLPDGSGLKTNQGVHPQDVPREQMPRLYPYFADSLSTSSQVERKKRLQEYNSDLPSARYRTPCTVRYCRRSAYRQCGS